MGSGGSQTSQQSLPSWAVPYAKEGLKSSFNYYLPGGSPRPYEGPSQNVANLTPDQLRAFGYAGNLAGGGAGSVSSLYSPYTPDAQNPYVDAMVRKAQENEIAQYQHTIAPDIMSRAAQTGTLGSSSNRQSMENAQTALATRLADIDTSLRGHEFDATMQRGLEAANARTQGQLAANQQLAQMGGQEQQQQQNVLDTAFQNAYRIWQWPQNVYSQTAGLIPGFVGNQLTTKVSGGGK